MSGSKNRTKGNVKPSSSSQAARLLAETGATPAGFIGFGAGSGIAAYVPASETFDDADSTLDSDFRMILRKLTKRDATTKIKALGEFGMLCQDKDDACLVAVLPFWPRIYNKMAMDVDHKVRESAQTAMTALVSRVGRNLAPYLKSVIGVWILSCNDTYPGVAAAARQAFQTAFPEKKQKDVIIFCKQVLVEYMIDNISTQTAATLSDPKTTEEDEREAKYHRVLSSSLKGLHQLLQTLPSEELEGIKGHFRGLLNDGKFWKLAKSPIPKVQSDLFWLLGSLCQVLSEMALEYVGKLSPLILGSIDSAEVMVLGGIWSAVLSLVKYLPTCWEHINWQKAFWPKLRNVLESGCQVAPSIIAPNLLPLMSRLPVDVAGGAKLFYPKLLEHAKLGLLKGTTSSDFGMAYVECLQFALKEILSKDPSATETAESLVLDQLEALVEASLLESALSFHRSEIYGKVAAFVASIEQKKDSTWLASHFWEKLTKAVLESFDSLDTAGDRYLRSDRLVVFVKAILSVGKSAAIGSEEKGITSGPRLDVQLPDLMKAFVDEVMLQSYKAYRGQGRCLFLRLLADLARLYFPLSSVKLIAKAAEDTMETSCYKSPAAHNLLPAGSLKEDFAYPYASVVQKIVLPALSEAGDEKLDEEAADDAITLLFACLARLSQVHSTVVWEAAFQSAGSTRALCCLIERALDSKSSIPQGAAWMASPQLTACLSRLVTAVTASHSAKEEELAQAWKVLSLVLSASNNKEPVFPHACIEEIIVGVHTELVRLSAMHLAPPEAQRALQFVARASAIFFQRLEMSLTLPATKDLILGLLRIDLESNCLRDSVTEKLVREAWGAGVGVVVANTGGFLIKDGVLDRACYLIHQATAGMVSYKEYKHVMNSLEHFLQTASDNLPADDGVNGRSPNPCILEFLRLLAAQIQRPCETEKVLHHLCMEGQMCLVSLEQALGGNAEQSSLTRTIFSSLYNMQLLHYSQMGTLKLDVGEMVPSLSTPIKSSTSETKEPEDRGNILVLSSNWETEDVRMLIEAVQALCLARIIQRVERHVDADLVKAVDELEKLTVLFVRHLPAASKKEMINLAITRAFDKSGVSSLTLAHLLQMLEAQVTGVVIEKESSSPGGKEEREGQETGEEKQTMCVHVQMLEQCIQCAVDCQAQESCHDTLKMLVPQMSTDVLVDLLERQGLAFLEKGMASSSLDMTTACLQMVVSCFTYLPQDKCEEVVQQVVDCLARIKDGRDAAEDLFLFACELTEKSSSCLSFNIAVVQCMAVLVCKGHKILTRDLWDFILCSLVSWIESLIETNLSLSSAVSIKTFAVAACRLMVVVARCIQQQVPTNRPAFPPNLELEWKEFFSEGLFSVLLPLFVRLVEDSTKNQEPGSCVVLSALGSALSLCPKENIQAHKLPPKYLACEDTSPLPDSLQSLLNHLCPLLTCTLHAVQVTAYTLLERVIADLPAYEKEQKVDEGQKEEVSRSPPAMLMKVIEDGAAAMDIVLADVDIETCVAMVPGTEEYQFALGYLLAWQLALTYFHSASSELRAEYAAYFKENRLVEQLLKHLFRLMPRSTAAVTRKICTEISSPRCQTSVPVNSPSPAKTETTDTDSSFTSSETSMSPDESGCTEDIQKLACHVYTHCLQVVPALVRQWWKDLDRKSAAYVDRFTSKNVSPYLCKAEIQSVQELGSSIEDITVKAYRATREVTATYQMEEVNIEIQILLPENYPLGKISVSSQRRVGVNQSQWDRWLLQLNVFLQHQNGSIMEGLRLWKRNIDKRFEGVEECMVCYAVVHGTSFQLPRVQCRTCRKKFHSACLYKWFSTSQNSTCPLCRNLF